MNSVQKNRRNFFHFAEATKGTLSQRNKRDKMITTRVKQILLNLKFKNLVQSMMIPTKVNHI